jgi:chemotaxis protein methyltransferase CheR
MKKKDIEDIEIRLLFEAIYQRYGHDFRDYANVSIKRRVRGALKISDCKTITEITQKVLVDENFFQWFLFHFSITVTEWFRDPLFFKALREKVIPYLKTFPFIKIWHAGCATGEEAYSLAILLKEEGLYDRATIFATDFNDDSLAKASRGIYPVKDIKDASDSYRQTGGAHSLTGYFHAKYDSLIVDKSLKENITFANYNLVTDGVFGEMHLILCRNVLIYFDKSLQNRVLSLFSESLLYKGFLSLGSKESLKFSKVRDQFDNFDNEQKIFQKKQG